MIKWPIEQPILDAAIAHAISEFPKESCGIVVWDEYVPMENVAPDPHDTFAMNPVEYAKYAMQGGIRATIHSHPKGEAYPSKLDMESQEQCGIPSGIIVMGNSQYVKEIFFFGDQVPELVPYEKRAFRHGVHDCYSLFRDYYRREFGVVLPFFPRNPNWWHTDEDVLDRNYASMGFVEIPLNNLKRGDGVLFKILTSKKINHCGVYIGNGEVLHHLYGTDNRIRYSRTDNLYAWRDSIAKCVRYKHGFPQLGKGAPNGT